MLQVMSNNKLEALAKLLNVDKDSITQWSDGSLTHNNTEYDTKKGCGLPVGKQGRFTFYNNGRV